MALQVVREACFGADLPILRQAVRQPPSRIRSCGTGALRGGGGASQENADVVEPRCSSACMRSWHGGAYRTRHQIQKDLRELKQWNRSTERRIRRARTILKALEGA